MPVYCDANRVAQLFSNLLRNAVSYGKPGEPVIVKAITTNDTFTLSVINKGEPIPAEKMAKLFQPFSRSEENKGQQGLGLGLYIAAEIAKAHGGTLTSSSDNKSTKFTLEMPVR
nr:sensor histidine kinase [Ferruginibacter sp. HRS2-29]